MAVLPPALAAAAAFPLRRFIPDSAAVVDARNKLASLGIAAYIFTVAFSINTLWNQDIELANSAMAFDYSVSSLKDAARDHADDLPSDIDEKIEALRQPNVIDEGVSVRRGRDDAFDRALDELTGAWADAPAAVGIDLEPHVEDAALAFFKLSQSANSPGVPSTILVAITLLGMWLAGVMAAAPRSAPSNRGEATSVDWMMIAAVLVIGLVQWPLWVLNSKDFVLLMILPYFSEEVRLLTGLHVAAVAVVLVAPFLVTAFLLRTSSRHRRHRRNQPDADQPRLSDGGGALANRVTESQADPENPPAAPTPTDPPQAPINPAT